MAVTLTSEPLFAASANFARVVVAVQLTFDEAAWLEDKAMCVRQGFMDPKQSAAFEEFLARQSSVGEQ
ncbi:hypothetical protein [Streptomyces atratus]